MATRSVTAASLLILAFFVAVASLSTTAETLGGGSVGGRTKVPNVKKDREVQDLGRYSVVEYNRVQRSKRSTSGGGGDLRFKEVVEAEKQVVSGIKYFLKVAAFSASSGVPKMFDAVVVVKPWVHSKELLNFAPSPATK